MYIKHFFKLRDSRLFATEILRYKCNLSRSGFNCVFFLKDLTLLFWRLKVIRGKLHFRENLFITKRMKMHSWKHLVLCYYFKNSIFFPEENNSRPGEKYKFHSTAVAISKIMQNTI